MAIVWSPSSTLLSNTGLTHGAGALPSTVQVNVTPAWSAVNRNLARRTFVSDAGPERICVGGATASFATNASNAPPPYPAYTIPVAPGAILATYASESPPLYVRSGPTATGNVVSSDEV